MYALISFSHKNTNVALRENLHFDNAENLEFLAILQANSKVKEAVLLSTCNRCEVYIFFQDLISLERNLSESLVQSDLYHSACKDIIGLLAQYKKISESELQNNALIELGNHAIHHVFCVASSLFSVVIGETQISGQMKEAYKLSYDHNFCSKSLTRLFHFAFRCAAAVRNSTDISKNPVSVASIAVNIALDCFHVNTGNVYKKQDSLTNDSVNQIVDFAYCPFHSGDIQEKDANKEALKFLVVGVGEMGMLCLKHLSKHNIALTLCNRTQSKAQELLQNLALVDRVDILDFSLLQEKLNEFDAAFFAVAGGAIVTKEMLKPVSYKRIFFDLSIPRNLSISAQDLVILNDKNLEIIGVDDLKNKAQTHIDARKESARMAMGIVGQFVLEFEQWLSGLGVDPVIKVMREQAKFASIKTIDRAIKKGFIEESMRDNVTKLLHSAFNEFLHSPTIKLKNIAENDNADSILEAINNVFGVQDRILLNRYKCEYDNTDTGV